jgi:hypothetical protein
MFVQTGLTIAALHHHLDHPETTGIMIVTESEIETEIVETGTVRGIDDPSTDSVILE